MSKKHWDLLAWAVRVFAVILVIVLFFRSPKGSEGMVGLWEVSLAPGEGGEPVAVTWLIEEVAHDPKQEEVFQARGCMQTGNSGGQAPLSLEAHYDPELDGFTLVAYSTLIPAGGDPYIIRFTSDRLDFGSTLAKGQSSGTYVSDPGAGAWSAEQQSRSQPSCESLGAPGLAFWGDVYAYQDLAFDPPESSTIYETITLIVSSGLQVDTPSGKVVTILPYVDIFSPDTDFTNEFRYLLEQPGLPMVGEAYTFSLLDVFGEPFPGVTARDVWTGCTQGAPSHYTLEIHPEEDIKLAWDEVPVAAGWDPGGDPQVGYYQIHITPKFDSGTSYGSAGIASAYHMVPWAPFAPGVEGIPDGGNLGVSLSEFDDGTYEVAVMAFADAVPATGGVRLECFTSDSSQYQRLVKAGQDLDAYVLGRISGRVFNQAGELLPNVWVDGCEYSVEPQMCDGRLTNRLGAYRLIGLPAGAYRVKAGGFGWVNTFYDGTWDFQEAEQVLVAAGEETQNIDLIVELGGTISGTVLTPQGATIEAVWVLACQYEGGYCLDSGIEEDGSYQLVGLPAGDYRVSVSGEGFEQIFYNDTKDHEIAARVRIVAGEHTEGIDFTIR